VQIRREADATAALPRYGRRMRTNVEALLGSRRARAAGDTVLALGLAAFALGDALVAAHHGSGWFGPAWARLVVALVGTVPLVWRVGRPLEVFALVWAAAFASVLLAGGHQGPFELFVAVVVAAYSVGAHTEGSRARFGLVLLLLPGLVVAPLEVHRGQAAGNVFPTIVWTFGVWLIGRVVRSWRERAVALERLNRELDEQRGLQAEAAVAVERGRIARELHDVIGHNVSMMVVQAGAAARVLEGDQSNVRNALTAIEQTGRQTVDEMRRLIGIVRRDDGLALSPQPTLRDVEQLIANVREAGLHVELRVEGAPIELPSGVDLSAYRIVQEALTNTLKHAGPANATVTVRYEIGAVEVEVRDDGASTEQGTGNGLIGMRERVALWGGELEAGRSGERGFAVRARLPLGGTS
jgi:signal transduction histidine kinase